MDIDEDPELNDWAFRPTYTYSTQDRTQDPPTRQGSSSHHRSISSSHPSPTDNDRAFDLTYTFTQDPPAKQRTSSHYPGHSLSGSHPSSPLSRPVTSLSANHGSKPYSHRPATGSINILSCTWTPLPLGQPRHVTPNSECGSAEHLPYSSSPQAHSPSFDLSYQLSSRGSCDAVSGTQQHDDLVRMDIQELLWIPSISELYHKYQNMKDQIVDMSTMMSTIVKTNMAMYSEVSLLWSQLDEV